MTPSRSGRIATTLPRRPAQHIAGGRAHLQHLAGDLIHRHDGRLPQNDALALCINQNVGRAQINAQISGKKCHWNLLFARRRQDGHLYLTGACLHQHPGGLAQGRASGQNIINQ